MIPRLARLILAFSTFPLIGAYGLRWVGDFVGQIISASGVDVSAFVPLDIIGGVVGLILGLVLAVQIVGCAFQPESSGVRPAADNILIILGLTLLLDLALGKLFAGQPWLQWLPAANLVIWSGAAAATNSLHRMRPRYLRPPAPPTALPPHPNL